MPDEAHDGRNVALKFLSDCWRGRSSKEEFLHRFSHFAKNHFFLNAAISVLPVPNTDCIVVWALKFSTYCNTVIIMHTMYVPVSWCGSAHTGMLHASPAASFATSEVLCNRVDMQSLVHSGRHLTIDYPILLVLSCLIGQSCELEEVLSTLASAR